MKLRRWIVVAAAAALVVTAAVGAPAQTRIELKEPYLQLKIAYVNGFLAGAKYIAQQLRAGEIQPASLKDAFFESDAFKQVVAAMVQTYAARLGQLNKAKQPTPTQ
jgi:hypothetical protein